MMPMWPYCCSFVYDTRRVVWGLNIALSVCANSRAFLGIERALKSTQVSSLWIRIRLGYQRIIASCPLLAVEDEQKLLTSQAAEIYG